MRPATASPSTLLPWLGVAAILVSGCGGSQAGYRQPTQTERRAITHWVQHWWAREPSFSEVRKRGLHDVVARIRISRRDPHFAAVDISPRDAHGKQALETAQLGMLLVAGRWTIAIGPGTDLSSVCDAASPRPLIDLYCG